MSSLRLAMKQSLAECGLGPPAEAGGDRKKGSRRGMRKRKYKKRGRPPNNPNINTTGSLSDPDEEGISDDGEDRSTSAGNASQEGGSDSSLMGDDGQEDDVSMEGVFDSDMSSDNEGRQRHRRKRPSNNNNDGEDEDDVSHKQVHNNMEKMRALKLLKQHKKKRRNSAANVIQNQWKKRSSSTTAAPSAAAPAAAVAVAAAGESVEEAHNHKKQQSADVASPAATHPQRRNSPTIPANSAALAGEKQPQQAQNNSTAAAEATSTTKTGKARTVPPPSVDVLTWTRSMPNKHQRRNIVVGHRVKVRFSTQVKRDGKISRKKKWYGGLVTNVFKNGKKIRIKYDDGTSERAGFPDKDIVVDDEGNGAHEAPADAFLPPLESSDDDTVSTPPSRTENYAESAAAEEGGDRGADLENNNDIRGQISGSSADAAEVESPTIIPQSSFSTGAEKVEDRPTQQSAVNAFGEHHKTQEVAPLSEQATVVVEQESTSAPVAAARSSDEGGEEEEAVTAYTDDSSAVVAVALDDDEEDADSPESKGSRKAELIEELNIQEVGGAGFKLSKQETREEEMDADSSDIAPRNLDIQEEDSRPSLTIKIPPLSKIEADISANSEPSGKVNSNDATASNVPPISVVGTKKDQPHGAPDEHAASVVSQSETGEKESSVEGEADKYDVVGESPAPIKGKKRAGGDTTGEEPPRKKMSTMASNAIAPKVEKEGSFGKMEVDSSTEKQVISIPPKIHIINPKSTESSEELTRTSSTKVKESAPPPRVKIGVRETANTMVGEGAKATQRSPMPSPRRSASPGMPSVGRIRKRRSEEKLSPMPKKSSSSKRSSSPRILLGEISEKDLEAPPTAKSKSSKLKAMQSAFKDGEDTGRTAKMIESANSAFERKGSNPAIEGDAERISTSVQEDAAEAKGLSLESSTGCSKPVPPARSGRRAAQQANERIYSKQERVIVDEFAKVKKKREKQDLKLFSTMPSRKRVLEEDEEDDSVEEEEDDNWVQCEKCLKWRHLPASVKTEKLPDHWYCELNIYDPKRNSCDANEQTPEEVAKKKRRAKRARQKRLRLQAEEEAKLEKIKQSRDASREGKGSKSSLKEEAEEESIERNTSISDLSGAAKPKRPRSPVPTSKKGRSKSPGSDSDEATFDHDFKKLAGTAPPGGKRSPDLAVSSDGVDSEPPSQAVKMKTGRRPGRPRVNKESDKSNGKEAKDKDGDKNQEWVQCEKCHKWRKLPPTISAATLPDVWYCTMNTWDANSASCEAVEDKQEVYHIGGINGTSGQTVPATSGKLSYRSLILGTGKKLTRPGSEKTRVAESLFVSNSQNESGLQQPTLLYANSSAFVARGIHGIKNVDENENVSMFDLMQKSQLWAELYAGARLLQNSQVGPESAAISDTEAKQMRKRIVLDSLQNGVLSTSELLWKAQSVDSTVSASLGTHQMSSIENVLGALDELVREGEIEVISEGGKENLYRRRERTVSPKFSRCMKIAKPWKRRTVAAGSIEW